MSIATIHDRLTRTAAPARGFGQDAWQPRPTAQAPVPAPALARDRWEPQGGGAPIGRSLREEMRGADVRQLQVALKAAGFDPGTPDGDFGAKTEAALRRFQRARGLEADGVAGPKSLAALGLAFERGRDSAPAADAVVKPSGKGAKDYRDLKRFAEARGFTVTSTNGGKHNKGSAHYQNRAIDVRTRDKTKAQVDQFIREARAAGFKVGDERRRPKGQAVWSGPHLHLEIPRR